ncbi:hypothetical protein ACWDA7_43000 [Streptomyces sp. NPDC001156]
MPPELATQEQFDAFADEVARRLGTHTAGPIRCPRTRAVSRGWSSTATAAPCACASPTRAAPTG